MKRLRASRLSVWLALGAMLLGALAPTVSHALARARSAAPWTLPLCTSGGGPRSLVPAPAALSNSLSAAAPDGPAAAPSLDDCPFCLPIADRLGPPPAASRHFFTAEFGLARPDAQALFFRSFPTPAPWPRGPPLVS